MSAEPNRAHLPERRSSPRPPLNRENAGYPVAGAPPPPEELEADGPGGPFWLTFVLVGIAATIWLAGMLLELW